MIIVPLVVGGAMQESTYIVGSEETKECIVIPAEAGIYLRLFGRPGFLLSRE